MWCGDCSHEGVRGVRGAESARQEKVSLFPLPDIRLGSLGEGDFRNVSGSRLTKSEFGGFFSHLNVTEYFPEADSYP